ncbi:carbonic anhydrase [Dyella solisilvae]|uniref:carbonic anhydrase n=2 Tax=Dyella solisilvae TaxID=1920168 RepID=A0A370K5V4_9GAMM|nr:carbonic anhydrase [Dyella solisilvae]
MRRGKVGVPVFRFVLSPGPNIRTGAAPGPAGIAFHQLFHCVAFHRGYGVSNMAARHFPPFTSDEALARLKDGNERFISGRARFPTMQKEILAELAKEQHPHTTILGCSDSRVPPELVFDASFGELFVIRVAGNVLGAAILGTLQYAGQHLHTPLFVVMGHEGCGAVDAALASKFHSAKESSRIEVLLEDIVPALRNLDGSKSHEALLHEAVEANVRYTMRSLLDTPEVQARLVEGQMKLVGAVYEIESGRVRFLE